jgi:hypothetical protein
MLGRHDKTLVGAAVFAACIIAPAGGSSASGPELTISPSHVLVDQPVNIKVRGLARHEPVTLVTSTVDALGKRWKSRVVLRTGNKRVVQTHGNMRFVWSMAPPGRSSSYVPQAVARFRVKVVIDHHTRASAFFWRRMSAPKIKSQMTTLEDQGFIGTYFTPSQPSNHSAVLLLGGSEGGELTRGGALYASHGLPWRLRTSKSQGCRRLSKTYRSSTSRQRSSGSGANPASIRTT